MADPPSAPDPAVPRARLAPPGQRKARGASDALEAGVRHFADLRYDAALRDFERASQVAPHDLDARRCLAHGLYHAGRAEEALALYRELIRDNPDTPEVRYNIGQILVNQGRLEQARGHFEWLADASIEFAPDEFYLGLLFPTPDHFLADCHYYLAIICWNRGETPAAEHYFDLALGLNPVHIQACHHLADLLFQAQDHARSIGHYLRYLELLGEDSLSSDEAIEAACNLGVARLETGEAAAARETFQSILRDRPGHPRAVYHMNLIFQREGEPPPPAQAAIEEIEPEGSAALAGASPGPTADGATIPIEMPRPIIGRGIAMRRVLRFARLAAASDASVMLTGENGTGKELIARAIHANSERRDQPFMPVNCAAIPAALIESELFGHEMGSFTGAVERKIGRFEAADRGTIFLDEIGELDINMQVKLLRFLQERELSRVGGTETIPIDVRIIAATNRDLEEALEKRLFRQDLYYRLNVLPIHIPPLRERAEDIPLLVDHFVGKYGKESIARDSLVGEEDMDALIRYEWPGNVRELENAVERATVLGTQMLPLLQGIEQLRRRKDEGAPANGLPPEPVPPPAPPPFPRRFSLPETEAAALADLDRPRPPRARPVPPPPAEPAPAPWEPKSIREIEREHIHRMLEHTGGNKSKAARLLGINPATLWRKIKSYEIETPGKPAVEPSPPPPS